MRRQRIELWTVKTNEFTAHLLTSIGILPTIITFGSARGSFAAHAKNLFCGGAAAAAKWADMPLITSFIRLQSSKDKEELYFCRKQKERSSASCPVQK